MDISALDSYRLNIPAAVTPKASAASSGRANPALYEQCQNFESIFVGMMIKEMRSTVDKTDSLISGGWAEEIYQSMLDTEYSTMLSKNARFGLADQLYSQLSGRTAR